MKMLTKISLVAALFVSSSAAFAATPATAAPAIESKAVVVNASEIKPMLTLVSNTKATTATLSQDALKQPVTCTVGVSILIVSFEVSFCCANCE